MAERDKKGHFLPGNSKAWKPGQSGNPSGRDMSIVKYIREQTDSGREVVDFLLKVMRGEDEFRHAVKQRVEAGKELLHQGYGTAPVKVEIGDADGENVVRFTMEIGPAGAGASPEAGGPDDAA